MEQSDRERFEALIAAKRAKGEKSRGDHGDERKDDRRRSPKSSKPFRRKV